MDETQEYTALIKQAFGKLAPSYDLIAAPAIRLRGQAARLTAAAPGSRVLDVATGTGSQAIAFARLGYEVVGVDLSEAMLEVAQKKNKYGNLRFEPADATHLSFPDESFDVSCISFALHDMPLTIEQKVLKEMVRVTKTEGCFVIVDYGLPRNGPGRFLIYRLVGSYEGEYYHPFIQRDLRALLMQAGIEVTQEVSTLLGAARILKGKKAAKAVEQRGG